MNKVILSGRLTRDPEIRYCGTDNGTCVARFSLAVPRNDRNNTADFISIKVLGKRAEWIEKYIKKGSRIELDGSIQSGSYENERGEKVYYTEVMAYNVEFGESKKDAENQSQNQADKAAEPNQADKAAEPTESNINHWGFNDILDSEMDNLPFN